jgi:hypothetical protein
MVPALAERRSITTVQGSEWFGWWSVLLLQEINEDANKCIQNNLGCVNRLRKKYSLDYSH